MKNRLTTKPTMKKRIKLGKALLRVSTEMQALTQYGSLDAQRQRITRWRDTKNGDREIEYQIKDWVEEEQSAFRDKNYKRKQMMQLMSDMETGGIDFIAFESISRLFRSVEFASKYLR
jgi:ABC-type lipoprotein release transport system permease subunit